MKKESRRELQCKDDELEDARAASGKKVMMINNDDIMTTTKLIFHQILFSSSIFPNFPPFTFR